MRGASSDLLKEGQRDFPVGRTVSEPRWSLSSLARFFLQKQARKLATRARNKKKGAKARKRATSEERRSQGARPCARLGCKFRKKVLAKQACEVVQRTVLLLVVVLVLALVARELATLAR